MARYCDDIPVGCDVCCPVSYPCGETMLVAAGLAPGSYHLWVRDKFLHLYTYTFTVSGGGSGSFVIDPDQFPEGYFNQYAGAFDVWVSTDSGGLDVVGINLQSPPCPCLTLNITT